MGREPSHSGGTAGQPHGKGGRWTPGLTVCELTCIVDPIKENGSQTYMQELQRKLLEENIGSSFHDFGLGCGFLGHQNGEATEEKAVQRDSIKVKSLCFKE